MKILFLTSFSPPTHLGGTENYTFALAKSLVRAGHTARVLCAGEWDQGPRHWNGVTDAQYDGVQVRRLNLNWTKAADPNRCLYDNALVGRFVRRELDQWRADVVHCTSCITLSASVLAAVRDAGVPQVLTLMDSWFLCPRTTLLRSDGDLCSGRVTPWECLRCMLLYSKAYRLTHQMLPARAARATLAAISQHSFLSRWRGLRGMALDMQHRQAYLHRQLQLPEVVLAHTRFIADVFTAAGAERPIQVQAYGHEFGWLERLSVQSAGQGLRFGFLGTVTPIKGVDVLIRAFARILDIPDVCLQIWGDLNHSPAYAEAIRGLVSASAQIELCGRYTPHQLGSILGGLDVVVVPSVCYENSPLVIHEAFAAKVPVIATNLGGMPGLVHEGVNGLLFERGDVEELALQMRRLASEPGLLARLKAGIEPVKTVDQEAAELTELYGSLERTHRARAQGPRA